MAEPENVKVVYQQLCESYRAIDDFRMKLLGLLPLATGAGILLLANDKISFVMPFLLPVGVFGALIAFALFSYELYGVMKCHRLIETGRRLEEGNGLKVFDGQFRSRPGALLGFINEPFASGIIYPAVLAAWTFVALLAQPIPIPPQASLRDVKSVSTAGGQSQPAPSAATSSTPAEPPTHAITPKSREDAERWALVVFFTGFAGTLAFVFYLRLQGWFRGLVFRRGQGTPAVQIRAVTSSDREAWLDLREALWPGDGRAEHRKAVDRFFGGDRREPAEVLLAIDHHRVVGLAELSIRNVVDGCSTGRVGYLEGWYVVPEARRGGIGRALIAAAEQWARDCNCSEFGSDAAIDNHPSVAAHRALGFEETGRAITFRKSLSPEREVALS
jgi:aminoglycoside 6'-N-acetyltransferase I